MEIPNSSILPCTNVSNYYYYITWRFSVVDYFEPIMNTVSTTVEIALYNIATIRQTILLSDKP